MTHKQYQHPIPGGGVDVQFNLEFDGQNVSVEAIQLHSWPKMDLPRNPNLEFDTIADEWKLCAYYTRKENGQEISVREWCNSDLCKDIVN